jgi:outer membrane protein
VGSDSRTGVIGLQVNVPIYQGGFTESRVREAIALQEKSRQDLEAARRVALFAAQTGFAGVTSATASVKAFEQAVVSAESALSSNIVGQEVGVRTFSTCSTFSRTSTRPAAISRTPTSST